MPIFNRSSGRTAIDVSEASEIADRAGARDPNTITRADMQSLLGASALVLDGLRRRPRYFDGRFLTGTDLTRDQDYVRQRQGDLARACGSGVVTGLEVRLTGAATSQRIAISPGHGITPSGDLVLITTRRDVDLLDLPGIERLDASMGLRLEPRLPLGRRTGLFILALRAVEFTANPIAAYPTSITGPRQVEDSDVIEATAITLIPYPDSGGAASLAEARRAVARRLFVEDSGRGMPQDALPLAMLAMERGSVRWIDMAMVRRETGADTPLQVSMGARPRALAEAHVTQYSHHLLDVLQERRAAGLGPAFAAAQYFAALPAAGSLPAAAIFSDELGFKQLWFPPACDVDLSFAPEDEIAAIVEDSLALPPIDLEADPADLDATGIVVLAPVTRQRLQRFEQGLAQLTMKAASDPAQGIRRAPADMLAAMLRRRTKVVEAIARDAEATARIAAANAEIAAWRAAWAEAIAALAARDDGAPPLIWYVRRRAVAYRPNVTGIAVAISGDDATLTRRLSDRVTALGLRPRFNAIEAAATPFAEARMTAFLGSPRMIGSDLLLIAGTRELERAIPPTQTTPPTTPPTIPPPSESAVPTRGTATTDAAVRPSSALLSPRLTTLAGAEATTRPGLERLAASRLSMALAMALPPGQQQPLTEGDVLDVASDFGHPALGDGLARLFAAMSTPEVTAKLTAAQIRFLGDSGHVLELDRLGRTLADDALPNFVARLIAAVTTSNASDLAALIAGQD
jgi:hypothetical protein